VRKKQSERIRGIPHKLVEEGVKLPDKWTQFWKHESRLDESFWFFSRRKE